MAQKQVEIPERLIVIGGSSGSLDALLILLPALKKDFSIPVLLVLHRSNLQHSGLSDLLDAKTNLSVREVSDKELLRPGYIYVAPPDYHVLPEADGTLSLDASEKVYYSRPSIDVSFTSAARAYRDKLVAILLSGANADGAGALTHVKDTGGVTIVQDPKEAAVPYMPEQALIMSPIDYVLNAAGIAALLNSL